MGSLTKREGVDFTLQRKNINYQPNRKTIDTIVSFAVYCPAQDIHQLCKYVISNQYFSDRACFVRCCYHYFRFHFYSRTSIHVYLFDLAVAHDMQTKVL